MLLKFEIEWPKNNSDLCKVLFKKKGMNVPEVWIVNVVVARKRVLGLVLLR